MDAASLRRLLPRDRNDVDAASALVAMGHAAVEPVLPQMLEWLKTNGSPVEQVMRPFFVALGAKAVPIVRKALASRHDLLKYSLVAHVVAFWPADAIAGVRSELQMLATGAGSYGTDLIALRLLAENGLADRDWMRQWARFKTTRLRELLAQAEHIDRLLST